MKTTFTILRFLFWLLIGLSCLYWGLHYPGGPFNQHDWMGDHVKQELNFHTFMFIVHEGAEIPGEQVKACFDICLKHGELRPIPCD